MSVFTKNLTKISFVRFGTCLLSKLSIPRLHDEDVSTIATHRPTKTVLQKRTVSTKHNLHHTTTPAQPTPTLPTPNPNTTTKPNPTQPNPERKEVSISKSS